MINVNTVVGERYRVVKPLGGGGMKLVYLAEDLRLAARPCALAEMIDTFGDAETQRQAVVSFQREADMLAQLDNEHIPRIYDRFSEGNRHYLVMEYIAGETLEQRIKASGGRLAETTTIEIALQILETLEYLHGLNPPVIYRDLKPSNIMLTESGLVKLVDFGIARHFQPNGGVTMIGTQGYAPPEQYRGKVDSRSDLYALGATMHYALSGRDPASEPPFSFPPLWQLCRDVNPALAVLVDEALSYDADRRPASAREFAERLLTIRNEIVAQGSSPSAAGAAAKPVANGPSPESSAPTVTISTDDTGAAPDIPCPHCARQISPDSRFCSYCAADLRMVLGSAHLADDESSADSDQRADFPAATRPKNYPRQRWPRRPRRGAIGPARRLVLLILFGWLALQALRYLLVNPVVRSSPRSSLTPPPPAAEPDTGSGFAETRPGSGSMEMRLRATMLRKLLDEQGYRSVQFKLTNRSIELWGSVPTETDRLAIEATAFAVTGVVSLYDRITVTRDGLSDAW